MKYLIELPDVIKDADGNEYESTGEFRKPKRDEHYFSVYSNVCIANFDFTSESHIILRHKWTWPTWLKGWGIAMDADGHISLHMKPAVMTPRHHWTSGTGRYIDWCVSQKYINFTLPTITDWTKPILNPHYKDDK